MAGTQRVDVAFVGAGIIGLSAAWIAARRGMDVLVLERDGVGRGASHVAAGMLAPAAEAEFGPDAERQLELGLRAAALWPGFAELLERESGVQTGLLRTGTLMLARDEDELRELERQERLRRALGLEVERLRGSQAREREPALAPAVRGALELPGDHCVDPRRVLGALTTACASAGVQISERTPVTGVRAASPGRPAAALLAGGRVVEAGAVVLAAGAWTESIEAPTAGRRPPVRPVKGQILRLRDPEGPGLLGRVLRFEGGYVVPRPDGRYVLGATVEERGLELGPTAGGVYELLREARELLPGILELEIEETATGLRPGTPDNLPAIGPDGPPGVLWACGHHRNGILLAPLTAELLAHLLGAGGELGLGGQEAEQLLELCSPRRFDAARDPVGAAR
jgi:glycine oxidase